MFDRDKWQEIIHTLKSNKMRTFLTAFGIFWGIFMLMILVGSGNAFENGVTHGFSSWATNSFFTWPQNTTMPYKGFKHGRYWYFTRDDMQVLINNVPEIKTISPTVHGGGYRSVNIIQRGLRRGSFRVDGVYPEKMEMKAVKITDGRWLNKLDIENSRKIAIIGARIVEELFEKDEDPVGEYIQINGVFVRVAGVFSSLESGQQARQENEYIYLPITTVTRMFNYGERVNNFAIIAKDDVPVTSIIEKCQLLLAERHSIHPQDKQAFGTSNLEEEFRRIMGLFKGIRVLVWIVGIGTLIAGVIGVSNIMLIIVKERTKDIGIQRAIGATPFRIINQIITEAIFLTSVAGMFGLMLGVLVVEGMNAALANSGGEDTMFRNPEVDFRVAVTAVIVMVILGTFAGFLPAKRAVNIKPIEAIRNE